MLYILNAEKKICDLYFHTNLSDKEMGPSPKLLNSLPKVAEAKDLSTCDFKSLSYCDDLKLSNPLLDIWSSLCLKIGACLCAQSCLNLWDLSVAHQASLSMEFSRQEYWSGLPFSTKWDLPDPGIKPKSLASPALAGRFFTTVSPGKPLKISTYHLIISKSDQVPLNMLC